MITRATLSTIEQGLPKYRSMLAGNTAYSPFAFESIATALPSASSTTTFSAIPSTYSHLQIRIMAMAPAGSPGLSMTVNGDTGSNYAQTNLVGTTTVTASVSTSRANLNIGNNLGQVQSYPNMAIVNIYDYASTTVHKNVNTLYGQNNASTGSSTEIQNGVWRSTSAITSITITSGANFSVETIIALYGIKG